MSSYEAVIWVREFDGPHYDERRKFYAKSSEEAVEEAERIRDSIGRNRGAHVLLLELTETRSILPSLAA